METVSLRPLTDNVRGFIFRTHLIGWSCVELSHRARHPISIAVSLGRAHPVVIRGLRLQMVHAHPKDHVAMTWVDSVRRNCRQVKVIGIFAVMHDGVVQDGASRIVCSPTDKGECVGYGFDGRADVDLGWFRTLTRACHWWLQEQYAHGHNADRDPSPRQLPTFTSQSISNSACMRSRRLWPS
jgi:hypothetical protein